MAQGPFSRTDLSTGLNSSDFYQAPSAAAASANTLVSSLFGLAWLDHQSTPTMNKQTDDKMTKCFVESTTASYLNSMIMCKKTMTDTSQHTGQWSLMQQYSIIVKEKTTWRRTKWAIKSFNCVYLQMRKVQRQTYMCYLYLYYMGNARNINHGICVHCLLLLFDWLLCIYTFLLLVIWDCIRCNVTTSRVRSLTKLIIFNVDRWSFDAESNLYVCMRKHSSCINLFEFHLHLQINLFMHAKCLVCLVMC